MRQRICPFILEVVGAIDAPSEAAWMRPEPRAKDRVRRDGERPAGEKVTGKEVITHRTRASLTWLWSTHERREVNVDL
jgi:hypothetical protein